MHYTIRTAAALLIAALVAAPSWAKDPNRPIIFQSGDIIGKHVKNPQGETLGSVEDFVVDKDGKIVYIALAVGETAGFGGKLYAVGTDTMKLEPGLQYYVLDVKKSDIDLTNAFDANRWPTRATAQFGKGAKAGGDRKDEGDKNDRVYRVSKIKGMSVKNSQGESLGRIYEVVLDMEDNNIAYTALSTGGVLGVGAKLFAVPFGAYDMKSLTLNPSDRSLVLNADKQDFANSPGFDTSHWPPKADDRWKKSASK